MEMYKGVEVKSRKEMFKMKTTGSAEELVKLLENCNNNGKEVLYYITTEISSSFSEIRTIPSELIFYTELTKNERSRIAISRYKKIIGEIEADLEPDLFDLDLTLYIRGLVDSETEQDKLINISNNLHGIEVKYEVINNNCDGKIVYTSLYEQLNTDNKTLQDFIGGVDGKGSKKDSGGSSPL